MLHAPSYLGYVLTEKLHEGNDTVIYRALRESDSLRVVLKGTRGEHPAPRTLSNLQHEYSLLRELTLPGVIRTYGLERQGGSLALVLEDFGGQALSKLTATRRFGLEEVLSLAVSIAETLEALHAHPILHKDLKPHKVRNGVARRRSRAAGGLRTRCGWIRGCPIATRLPCCSATTGLPATTGLGLPMRGPITSSVLRFSKGQPLCASLRAKGYVLSRDIGRYEEDDGPFGYLAQKNGFTFAADNPIELLELTSAYEYVRPAADEPYWWLVTGPNVADEILEASLERSLAERREREPERWRRTVQQALAAHRAAGARGRRARLLGRRDPGPLAARARAAARRSAAARARPRRLRSGPVALSPRVRPLRERRARSHTGRGRGLDALSRPVIESAPDEESRLSMKSVPEPSADSSIVRSLFALLGVTILIGVGVIHRQRTRVPRPPAALIPQASPAAPRAAAPTAEAPLAAPAQAALKPVGPVRFLAANSEGLFAYDSDGERVHQLSPTRDADGLTYLPDGSALLFWAEGLYFLDLKTRQEIKLAAVPWTEADFFRPAAKPAPKPAAAPSPSAADAASDFDSDSAEDATDYRHLGVSLLSLEGSQVRVLLESRNCVTEAVLRATLTYDLTTGALGATTECFGYRRCRDTTRPIHRRGGATPLRGRASAAPELPDSGASPEPGAAADDPEGGEGPYAVVEFLQQNDLSTDPVLAIKRIPAASALPDGGSGSLSPEDAGVLLRTLPNWRAERSPSGRWVLMRESNPCTQGDCSVYAHAVLFDTRKGHFLSLNDLWGPNGGKLAPVEISALNHEEHGTMIGGRSQEYWLQGSPDRLVIDTYLVIPGRAVKEVGQIVEKP